MGDRKDGLETCFATYRLCPGLSDLAVNRTHRGDVVCPVCLLRKWEGDSWWMKPAWLPGRLQGRAVEGFSPQLP